MEMSSNPLLINSTVHKYKLSCSFPTDNASQSRRCYLPEYFCIKVLCFVLLQTTSIQPPSPPVQRTPDLFFSLLFTSVGLRSTIWTSRFVHAELNVHTIWNGLILPSAVSGWKGNKPGHSDFHTNTTQTIQKNYFAPVCYFWSRTHLDLLNF